MSTAGVLVEGDLVLFCLSGVATLEQNRNKETGWGRRRNFWEGVIAPVSCVEFGSSMRRLLNF
jgi:hypothetical protein